MENDNIPPRYSVWCLAFIAILTLVNTITVFTLPLYGIWYRTFNSLLVVFNTILVFTSPPPSLTVIVLFILCNFILFLEAFNDSIIYYG